MRPPSENPLIAPGGGPDAAAAGMTVTEVPSPLLLPGQPSPPRTVSDTVGGSLLGIAGAFLAIPAAAFQLLITRVVWPRLGQA